MQVSRWRELRRFGRLRVLSNDAIDITDMRTAASPSAIKFVAAITSAVAGDVAKFFTTAQRTERLVRARVTGASRVGSDLVRALVALGVTATLSQPPSSDDATVHVVLDAWSVGSVTGAWVAVRAWMVTFPLPARGGDALIVRRRAGCVAVNVHTLHAVSHRGRRGSVWLLQSLSVQQSASVVVKVFMYGTGSYPSGLSDPVKSAADATAVVQYLQGIADSYRDWVKVALDFVRLDNKIKASLSVHWAYADYIVDATDFGLLVKSRMAAAYVGSDNGYETPSFTEEEGLAVAVGTIGQAIATEWMAKWPGHTALTAAVVSFRASHERNHPPIPIELRVSYRVAIKSAIQLEREALRNLEPMTRTAGPNDIQHVISAHWPLSAAEADGPTNVVGAISLLLKYYCVFVYVKCREPWFMKNIARWSADVAGERQLSEPGYNCRLAVYAIRVVNVLTIIVEVIKMYVGIRKGIDTTGLLTYDTATRDGYYAMKQIVAAWDLPSDTSVGSFNDLPPSWSWSAL
jgi:hypothetical protein